MWSGAAPCHARCINSRASATVKSVLSRSYTHAQKCYMKAREAMRIWSINASDHAALCPTHTIIIIIIIICIIKHASIANHVPRTCRQFTAGEKITNFFPLGLMTLMLRMPNKGKQRSECRWSTRPGPLQMLLNRRTFSTYVFWWWRRICFYLLLFFSVFLNTPDAYLNQCEIAFINAEHIKVMVGFCPRRVIVVVPQTAGFTLVGTQPLKMPSGR